jgi:hypothetical protein
MNEILGWAPVVWTARILLVPVMDSATWITLLLMIRFFRPGNLRKLLRAELPKLDEVGGEFGGAKANVKFVAQGKVLNALEERMAVLERHVETLESVDTNTLAALKESEREGRDES